MAGILEEGKSVMGNGFEKNAMDAALIASAQRVEHYEMAAYGTAIAHARLLDQEEVVRLHEVSLVEEKAADMKLTEIAETVVNLEAADESEDENEMELASAGAARGRQPAARPRATAAASSRARSGAGGRSSGGRGRSR